MGSFITSISDKINYEAITNTDEQLAVIPVTTIYNNLHSRIVLLEIEGELQSAILSLNTFESSTQGKFSGEMLVTDLNGNFIKGFRIENNAVVSQYMKSDIKTDKKKLSFNTSDAKSDCDNDCPFSVCDYCSLDEVVVNVPSQPNNTYISIEVMFPERDLGLNLGDYDYNYGGGSGSTNPDPEPETPCDELLEQLNNSNYSDRLNELLENVGSSSESGFAQNKDGSFTELSATNNGHSLNGMGPNTIGYTHRHTNGTLFSPKDINTFITMLTSAHFGDPQIPLNRIYGTVISDGEVYTIRYDGNWRDLDRNFDVSDRSYARYMISSNNLLDGFLNLLQSNNSSNFRIFNLDSSTNTVEELTLDSSSNTTRSNPCN